MIKDITIVASDSYPSYRYILSKPLHCHFHLCIAARELAIFDYYSNNICIQLFNIIFVFVVFVHASNYIIV